MTKSILEQKIERCVYTKELCRFFLSSERFCLLTNEKVVKRKWEICGLRGDECMWRLNNRCLITQEETFLLWLWDKPCPIDPRRKKHKSEVPRPGRRVSIRKILKLAYSRTVVFRQVWFGERGKRIEHIFKIRFKYHWFSERVYELETPAGDFFYLRPLEVIRKFQGQWVDNLFFVRVEPRLNNNYPPATILSMSKNSINTL